MGAVFTLSADTVDDGPIALGINGKMPIRPSNRRYEARRDMECAPAIVAVAA